MQTPSGKSATAGVFSDFAGAKSIHCSACGITLSMFNCQSAQPVVSGLLTKIFRDINYQSSAGNIYNDAALASVLRLHQLHFRAGAAAFCDAPDLFVGRFAKGKN